MSASVRSAFKHSNRERISTAAVRLFEASGYESTTVDEIAVEAGLSPRTVFRYFPTKAEMAFEPLRVCFEFLPKAIAAAPEANSILDVVKLGLAELAAELEQSRAIVSRHSAILENSPTLRFTAQAVAATALADLRRELARRTGQAPDSAEIVVLADVVFSIAFAARKHWLDDPSVSIADVMLRGIGAVERYF